MNDLSATIEKVADHGVIRTANGSASLANRGRNDRLSVRCPRPTGSSETPISLLRQLSDRYS